METPLSQTQSIPVSTTVREMIHKAHNRIGDTVFYMICVLCSLTIMITIGALVVQLVTNSQLSLQKFGVGFLTSSVWDPVNDEYGAAPFLFGTIITSLIGLFFALPLSLGIAIFLVEVASVRVRTFLSFLVETLAAIPSVVYGVWGVFVMVPFLQDNVSTILAEKFGDTIPLFAGPALGPSVFAASLILTIMILPIITSISRDVMLAIPMAQREAALALGSTKWESIRIVVANARWGILGAIILGLGRALGETIAVTMVIGNSPQIVSSIFQPGYTMASVIANEFNEATTPMYISALIEVGLVLLITTFVVNMLARLLVWSVTRRTVAGGRN